MLCQAASWVPTSASLPLSSTQIWWAWRTVDKRCATTLADRPKTKKPHIAKQTFRCRWMHRCLDAAWVCDILPKQAVLAKCIQTELDQRPPPFDSPAAMVVRPPASNSSSRAFCTWRSEAESSALVALNQAEIWNAEKCKSKRTRTKPQTKKKAKEKRKLQRSKGKKDQQQTKDATNRCLTSSNKCHASSNKCLTSSNKKLLEVITLNYNEIETWENNKSLWYILHINKYLEIHSSC